MHVNKPTATAAAATATVLPRIDSPRNIDLIDMCHLSGHRPTLPASLDEQLRDKLAHEILDLTRRWSLDDVVRCLAIHPSRFSRLRHGSTHEFSLAALLDAIGRLGYDIDVTLVRRGRPIVAPLQPTVTIQR